jgi:proteic killer suppression protein
MILSFGNRETEDLYALGSSRKIHPHLGRSAIRKLAILEAANDLRDLAAIQALRLEKLGGNLAGFHSIRVSKQMRIIFIWSTDGAREVELVDYH